MTNKTLFAVCVIAAIGLTGCNDGEQRLGADDNEFTITAPKTPVAESEPDQPAVGGDQEQVDPEPVQIVPASDTEYTEGTDAVTGMAVSFADRRSFVEGSDNREASTYWLKSRTIDGVRDARISTGFTFNPVAGDSHTLNVVSTTDDLDIDTVFGLFDEQGNQTSLGSQNIDMNQKVRISGVEATQIGYLSDGKTAKIDVFFCVDDVTWLSTNESAPTSREGAFINGGSLIISSAGTPIDTRFSQRNSDNGESLFFVRTCDDTAIRSVPTGDTARIPFNSESEQDDVAVQKFLVAIAGQLIEQVPDADGGFSPNENLFSIKNGIFIEQYTGRDPNDAAGGKYSDPDYSATELVVMENGEEVTQVTWLDGDLLYTVSSSTEPRIDLIFAEDIAVAIENQSAANVQPQTIHVFSENPFSNLQIDQSPVEIMGLETSGPSVVITHKRNGQTVSGAFEVSFLGSNPITLGPEGLPEGIISDTGFSAMREIQSAANCVGYLDRFGDQFACESFSTPGTTLIFE